MKSYILKPYEVKEIKRLIKIGVPRPLIAERYKIAVSTVKYYQSTEKALARGKRWYLKNRTKRLKKMAEYGKLRRKLIKQA